jgi:4-carboxymuconolactone decarboxylase
MPRKFKEIAIMLTSRYWGGQYVWYSHRQQALDAGLSPTFITAMAAGERPANMSSDEATVYDFCTQLLSTRQVSDTKTTWRNYRIKWLYRRDGFPSLGMTSITAI